MKNGLKILTFILYSAIIFMIHNFIILSGFAILNIFLMNYMKVNIRKSIHIIKNVTLFILLAAVINLMMDGVISAVLIVIRLLLVCNAVDIFRYMMSSMELADAIEKIISPLKILKVNPKDVSLIICIGVAFIPIFAKEVRETKYALKAKGMKIGISSTKIMLKQLFYSAFEKTNEVSNSLKAKGYVE